MKDVNHLQTCERLKVKHTVQYIREKQTQPFSSPPGISPGKHLKGASLPDILSNVLNFATNLNGRARDGQPKVYPFSLMETLITFLYRLVDITSLRQPCSRSIEKSILSPNDEMVQLGMLTFMTTFLPDYSRTSDYASYYPLLRIRLRVAREG